VSFKCKFQISEHISWQNVLKPGGASAFLKLWNNLPIGKKHHKTKPLKGFDGVMEIVSDYDKDTYRGVYAYKLGDDIYMLHAFKKKSRKGIKTPKDEIEIIKQRLKRTNEIAKE
jgi:phage-related protein